MKTNPMRTGQVGALLSCALLVLAACGGSGGSSSGGGGGGGTTFPLSGQALKGPFALGATMSVNEQNASLSPTGKVYNVQTTDYLGNFSVPTGVGTNLVEIIGDGFYMDDLTGQLSAAQIQLRAIVDLSVNAKPTVNVLTSLQEQRLKTLMSQSMSYTAAYAQSQTEVLAAFGIDSTKVNSLSTLYSMQYSGTTDADAVLLATSVMLSQMATDAATANGTTQPAELSNYINTFASQIANTGAITSSTFIAARNLAETEVNLSAIRSNVDSYYAKYGLSIVAPKFEEWIDKTGAGIVPQRLVPITSLAFTDVSSANPGQLVTSNVVTIAGLGAGVLAPVSVNVGTTIIRNNVAVTGVYAEVQDGDTIAMRVTSPGYDTTDSATISVGSSSAVWHVTSAPLGGNISGLTGTGLVLQVNGANDISVGVGSSTFSFPVAIANGTNYDVSVLTQPGSPAEVCDVSNGSGTVGSGAAAISVACGAAAGIAYMANGGPANSVSEYLIDAANGTLISLGTIAAGASPSSVVVDPIGNFVYVANEGSTTVSAYAITGSGALSSIGTFTAGTNPSSVAVNPLGTFLYAANWTSSDVSAFAINQATGALTIIGTVAASGVPSFITVDPTGRFAYTSNNNSSSITAYTINSASGALTNAGTVACAIPLAIGIEPTGKFAYIPCGNFVGITVYAINQTTGALTNIGTYSPGRLIVTVSIDPAGKFAYFSDWGPTSPPAAYSIDTYAIDATSGALTSVGSVATSNAVFFTLSPSGKWGLTRDGYSDNSVYSVNATTGVLTNLGTFQNGSSPNSIAIANVP